MKECFDTTSSTDFCKKVTSDEERSAYFGRDWESAREYNAEEIFNHFLKGSTYLRLTGSNVVGDKVDYRVQINYNPEAKFQYFTSESSVHDGTLLFQLEAMYKCVQRVVTGSTYFKRMKPPTNGCIVRYSVGNFVVLNEYDVNGDIFTPSEKPYCRQRTTVMLPIRVDIEREINEE